MLSEADITQDFVWRCSSNFAYFCEKVLDFEMTAYHRELAALPMQHKYLCIIIPRGFSKTSIFSIAYPLWLLSTEKDKKICLVSSSLDQSKKIFSEVQYLLETNPFFKKLLPVNRRDTWNRQAVTTKNHNQYFVKPFNSSARGMYPHHLICVTPNTFIDTINGAKKIKEIQEGDIVKTHKGRYKEVTKVMNRKHYGYVYEIVAGENKLRITGEHPVLSYRHRKMTPQGYWIKARRLKVGDYVCFPSHGKEAVLPITTARPKTNAKKLPSYVIVDRHLARLLGLFAAEGSLTDYGRITFSFHPMEKEFIEFVEKTMLKFFGLKAMHDTHNSWVHQVSFHSRTLAKVFERRLGRRAADKKVPFELLKTPVSRASFVKGWLDGDGFKGSHCYGASISEQLIDGIEFLCRKLGVSARKSVRYSEAYSNGKVFIMDFFCESKRKIESIYVSKRGSGFCYFEISSIKRKENSIGVVWNLEVEEDNSYIANGIAVHNCDDILREDTMNMKEIKEVFWSVFFPAGQTVNCQHIVVGTPQSESDLYAEIQQKQKVWKVYKRPAVTIDSHGNWKESLWPERFSIEKLKEIRNGMAPFRFEREYMVSPRSTGDMLFPQEMILNCLDYDLDFSSKVEGVAYIGNDYAMSTKHSGDYNVFLVVDDALGKPYVKKTDKGEVTIENPVFIREMVRFRGNVGQTEKVIMLHNAFGNARVVSDNSGVGAKFVKELRDASISVDAQDFQPAKRNMLLMNLRSLIEKGRLVIPADDESKHLTEVLQYELSGFRSVRSEATGHESWKSNLDHDDSVMALAMAVKNVSNPKSMVTEAIFGI